MGRFRDFLSLIKIGVVGSNALSAAAGFALASSIGGRTAPWERGALAVAGTALIVGGSCAINNWMDRDLDARMERTKGRPTARGSMGAAEALGVGAGLGAGGLGILLLAGTAAAALGLAGALVYLGAYTGYAKRRGAFSLYIGGIAGAAPPLIGWAAADPRLGGPAWALFGLLAVWQQAHVRALALKRAAEYGAAGIPMAGLSTPSRPQPARGVGASPQEGTGRRARGAVLAWTAATAPLPVLAIVLAGRPLAGTALAAAIASCLVGLAWLGLGLRARASPAWPARMFFASLAYLVLVLALLIVAGL